MEPYSFYQPDQMLKGIGETRFVVFGLIGSTRHHGKELLSSLLDYDLVSESTEQDSSLQWPKSRIQVKSFYGDRVVGYVEKSRCLMFLHFPFCQRESLEEQMELLILSALFSVCHIMIVLHKDTKFDITILHKIRTLQAVKNELVPVLQENYPMETTKSFVSLRRELQKAWGSMCPGYCQPHLFFLFQMDRSFPSDEDKLSKSIDRQISQIFQKFEIPGRRDPDPVINAFPVKVLLLPRMATTPNEHLSQWVAILDTPEQINDSIPHQTFQKFRLFIHQRRDRMREMLESRTFDPFPTLESVHEVFCFVLESLEMYFSEWKTTKEEMQVGEGTVPETSDLTEGETNKLRSVLFLYFDSTAITEKVATKQNQTAFQLAMNMYKQLAPDPCIEDVHRKALTRAKKVYDALSYGPERTTYDHEFTSLCEKMWRETRHQCGKKSLTGRLCIKALTNQTTKTSTTVNITECPHDSGFAGSSSDGTGKNLKERKDPFTMEQANKEFYMPYPVDQPSEGQPSTPLRSSRGSLKHKTSDQSIIKQLSDFCLDLELKIQCSINDQTLSFQKRHCTTVYGWCSLMTSTYGPASHKLNYEGFVGGKNQLYPLKLNLPQLGATMTSELDESFPPLRGHGQKPPPPLLWPQIQHQIKNLRQTRKQLKKHWTLDSSQLKTLMNPALRSSNQDKPSRRDESQGSSQARPNSSVDVWLGLEFEALDGTRFFSSPKDLSPEPDVDLLSVILTHDIPLFLPSPRLAQSEDETGVRSKSLAQLQRIVVMTPPGPSVFALNPCIAITAKEEPFMKVEFSLETPVVLPSSSLSILRLPFVYGLPSKWTQDGEADEEWYPLIQSSVDHPYNAVVQKRSIIFPC